MPLIKNWTLLIPFNPWPGFSCLFAACQTVTYCDMPENIILRKNQLKVICLLLLQESLEINTTLLTL